MNDHLIGLDASYVVLLLITDFELPGSLYVCLSHIRWVVLRILEREREREFMCNCYFDEIVSLIQPLFRTCCNLLCWCFDAPVVIYQFVLSCLSFKRSLQILQERLSMF